MKTLATLVILAGLVAAPALSAASAAPGAPSPVEITFEKPETFTDFTRSYAQKDYEQEHLMVEMREHLQQKAAPRLAEGQRLTVKFTDIDLAGDFEPWRMRAGDDVRIVKDTYPPRMKLEFKLVNADGSTAAEGTRSLSNLGFMFSMSFPQSDPLRYDKELLTDWVRREFVPKKK